MLSTDAIPEECRAMPLRTEDERILIRKMWNTGMLSLRPRVFESVEGNDQESEKELTNG